LVDFALDAFGRIDFLVLCAGVSMWARFDEIIDLAMYRRLMEVNYLGAVYCIHAALPALKENRGTIVAISSLQGEVAIPRHTGYSASKHALNGFLEALELELGAQVQILNVMPGWIMGTNLRANAFRSGGYSGAGAAKEGIASVSVQECSRLVLRSMQRGAKTLYVPRKLKALLWLKALAPSALKALIGYAVQGQEADPER
jgi:NAD(P)-dependent dehydrogenase (short-subunit alcohol dehydrogenase family)